MSMKPPADYEARVEAQAKAVADSEFGQRLVREMFLIADTLIRLLEPLPPGNVVVTSPVSRSPSITIHLHSNPDRKFH
jgi:hypothetical protein